MVRRPHPAGFHSYYYEWDSDDGDEDYDDDRVESLCCPDVTTLVLLNCGHREGVTIELDMPRMQRFKYRGCVDDFRLRTPPPDMRWADLHFIHDDSVHIHHRQDDGTMCDMFWYLVKNLRDAKVLKMKLDFPIDDVAVTEKKRFDEIMGETLFCNLDLLEMDGRHRRNGKDAGVAIGNLIQCCPALRELRLNLVTVDDSTLNRWRYSSHRAHSERSRKYLDRKALLDFRKSVGHFRFRCRKDPVVSTGGDVDKFEVSDIPGLSNKWFNVNCLQFYLRRVSLQFHMDKFNCFGIQLLKFFFERAEGPRRSAY